MTFAPQFQGDMIHILSNDFDHDLKRKKKDTRKTLKAFPGNENKTLNISVLLKHRRFQLMNVIISEDVTLREKV